MSNLINSIRDYILTCPFLSEWRVNVDYLGAGMEYSIDPLPCDPVIQRYTDGGAKKQFQFAFTSREEYDQDARINIIKLLKNGWKYRTWQENCRILEKIKSRSK